jgi:hypothetical protein
MTPGAVLSTTGRNPGHDVVVLRALVAECKYCHHEAGDRDCHRSYLPVVVVFSWLMSDEVLVAAIGAVAGVVGGAIGAIASPIGKDWVARREFERQREREREEQERAGAARDAEARTDAIRRTRAALTSAMTNYDLEWNGQVPDNDNNQGKPEAIRMSHAAWLASRELTDLVALEAVDRWKDALDNAEMSYRGGVPPRDIEALRALYTTALDALTGLMRSP